MLNSLIEKLYFADFLTALFNKFIGCILKSKMS